MADKSVKVVLVDDEDDYRLALGRRLLKRFESVKDFSNAGAALDYLTKADADVIVSDMKMPQMDGSAFLTEIKKIKPQIEFILLTGQANTGDGIDAIKKGAFDYLAKPIEIDHLISKIDQANERRITQKEKQEAKELKNQMQAKMNKAQKLASLGTLAAGVAHEINNPLAIINEAAGWMNLVLEKKEMQNIPRSEELIEAVSKISSAVKRAKKITHQLLESVKEEKVLSETDIKKLLFESVSSAKAEQPADHVEFIYSYDEKESFVFWLDPSPLRQTLINLVKNAAAAIKTDGKITLALKVENQTIKIEVTDTGTGIPEECTEKVFEPFFTTKSPCQGTGLGLFMIKKMFEKYGWNIDFKSKIGIGTTFYISIPIDQINVKKAQ